ncbi:MAG: M18 family aminopeptidase [Clostridia bacterium]|nr:M18 family aminopeptidase [Clostridia bacterium]
MEKLSEFLRKSYTAFHAVENAKALLDENGFCPLSETEDWILSEGGKYYVTRDGALIAFTVGSLSDFSYKIVASHTDSPALKLKENPVQKSALYATLNVETYGGGLWYSFLDRPLKIAGRVIRRENNRLCVENVLSPFTVTIPSLAIHQNREANDKLSLNPQIDLQPLLGLANDVDGSDILLENIAGDGVISHELFLVNADMPYSFGLNNEFLASPRIDNLTSVFASLNTLITEEERVGICVAACLDNEEIGNGTAQGAGGDFLENVLRRIAYAFRFDDNEYYKALGNSFLLSVDNAHAVHPNHPEKADTTNKTVMGGGIVIKNHANKAYVTDALSSAVVKTLFDNADVKYQLFFNRSDVRSGGTLGTQITRQFGILGVDIGLPQLAMHSSCECFKKSDYEEMEKGITAFYGAKLTRDENGIQID